IVEKHVQQGAYYQKGHTYATGHAEHVVEESIYPFAISHPSPLKNYDCFAPPIHPSLWNHIDSHTSPAIPPSPPPHPSPNHPGPTSPLPHSPPQPNTSGPPVLLALTHTHPHPHPAKSIVGRHVQQGVYYQKGQIYATAHAEHVVEDATVCPQAPRATMNPVLATLK
ncbi:hypothetical protein M8C21_001208, partial [Ambrosia artemisiifolia]